MGYKMMEELNQRGKPVKKCHMCGEKELVLILDLGHHPHSDDFLTPERLQHAEAHYPLRLVSCRNCGLLQIDYLVNPSILYQEDYRYESSTTNTGREHYGKMAHDIVKRFDIPTRSLVVDIGSNVGVLLQGFKDVGMKVLGVDPAPIVAEKAIKSGIETVINFFSSAVAEEIVRSHGKAKVITGTNVFAHLHEIHDAVEGMKILLANNGVIVIEAPYSLELIQKLEYDTIYHQHVGYLSVQPMKLYFEKMGMELFDVEPMSIHGGTLRYYVGHKSAHQVSERVAEYIRVEKSYGLYSLKTLDEFRNEVETGREKLLELLGRLKREGSRIVGISAPAKGNTLLNYCKIDTMLLDFVTEKAALKVGRFTPGTHIPIYDDQRILVDKPDYALILAWNFADEIMKNLQEYRDLGGKFIIPIPTPKIM